MDLPNYDLFEKFRKKEKVQKYIQFYQENEVINGIFNDIKPLIDELFTRFGITYDIIEENTTIECNGINVDMSKPEIKNLDYYFPLFFLNFWFYPSDAFHHKKIEKFIFCEELIISTSSYSQPRPAFPEWDKTHSMIYRMKIEDKDYLGEVMHHELFHYFDFMVSGSRVDSNIEAEWNELNPSDFIYGGEKDYKSYMENNNKEQIYFVSKTSMKQCCEDRAEIYSKLMTQTSEWENELSKNVQKKLKKIKDFMKKHSPNYIGNINNHYFERVQNFIDQLKK
jgi:heat shock protein HspQ